MRTITRTSFWLTLFASGAASVALAQPAPMESAPGGSGGGTGGGSCVDCQPAGVETPFATADDAPVLRALAHGHVLASRDYELALSLGELPGVGASPGLSLSVRLRSHGDGGACGGACQLELSRLTPDGDAYLLHDGTAVRRLEPDGSGFVEAPPSAPIPFEPATASWEGDQLVVIESPALERRFDADGREIERRTPWGALVLSYDGAGRLVSATNAAGASLSIQYDGNGRVASVSDPSGFTTQLLYSMDGHLIRLEGPADGNVTPSIQLTWQGDAITSLSRLGLRGVEIAYQDGKVSHVTDQDGNAYAFRSTIDDVEEVDAAHHYRRLVFAGGELASIETGSGSAVHFERDALGRVVETRVADELGERAELRSYDDDHRLTSITDAEGRVLSFGYDADGNLIQQTDTDGRITHFGHDAEGRVVSVTDPLGRTATTSYDANGLPTSHTAFGVTTTVSYNAMGLIASRTDAFGDTTHYGHDAHGRLVSVEHPGEPTISIARSLEAGGERVEVSRAGEVKSQLVDHYGRVVSASSSRGGTFTPAYDPITGLPTGGERSFRGYSQTTSMTLTNTGDASEVYVNGSQRQSAPRTVPPGIAWFGDGAGGEMVMP